MNDIKQDTEIVYTKQNARAQMKNGNYDLAITIFEALWNKSNKADPYLLYFYGQALRKVNESKVFINICSDLKNNQSMITNPCIISTLCWCLYDSNIKNYVASDKDGFINFIKSANYIIKNCNQEKDKHYINPYVLTIKKVIKNYCERSSVNYKEIIKWLTYLDPEILSEKPYKFQDENGKDRELASPKEFYYQHMAKAYEKTQQYEKCIAICETAFKKIHKFHYRNKTWLTARMYYSKCMLQNDIDNAILEYKSLAYKENYWFMYHKLSQICFRYNKIEEALLYASKSLVCKFEYEKMVNLMLDTAHLWDAVGKKENSKLFFQATSYYRKRQGWSIPEELEYAICLYKIKIENPPNIKEIQRISNEYIVSVEGTNEILEGCIHNILPHGGSGFIKPTNGGPNIYFNTNDILGHIKLSKGEKVEYQIKKVKDDKICAVEIKKRGGNHG